MFFYFCYSLVRLTNKKYSISGNKSVTKEFMINIDYKASTKEESVKIKKEKVLKVKRVSSKYILN